VVSPYFRWNTRDPLGMVEGPNLYSYVRGNPASYVDPLGLGPWAWLLTGEWNPEAEVFEAASDAFWTWSLREETGCGPEPRDDCFWRCMRQSNPLYLGSTMAAWEVGNFALATYQGAVAANAHFGAEALLLEQLAFLGDQAAMTGVTTHHALGAAAGGTSLGAWATGAAYRMLVFEGSRGAVCLARCW